MYEHIIAYWADVAKTCIRLAQDEASDLVRHALFLGAESSLNKATEYTRLAVRAETRRAA